MIEKQKTEFLLPKAENFVPSWVKDLSLMAARAGSASTFPGLTRPKRTARTPQDVLHFLETLSRGMRPSRAGWLCSFDQTETNSLMNLLGHLTHDPAKIPVLNDEPVSEDSRLGHVIKGPTAQRWQELRDIFLNRALPPLDGRDAIYQIGGPLQILLWLDDHFDALKGVMNSLGWEKDDLELYVPPSGAHTSSALAKEYGWSPLTTYTDSGGRKIHVDVARYPTLSKKPQTSKGDFVPMSETKDRVGVTVNLSHDASIRPRPVGLRERADLVRIWIAIHLRSD
ncbi:MAG: hypothetical protein A3J24_11585 [Deltaproteobacteria bacterium RIFCSPLOWO2_02_FULL_53_8]|nr:MAG: hypothetical protein A3J24_11585 [Deltaproteobacteria bacterium RIFCSPLOWO2_02_FULL_53_8]